MANPEHVAIVRRGADAIAEWRANHPHDRMGLVSSDLRGADLRGAYLVGAALSGADLGVADLRRADLSVADLFEANLGGADLGGASLFAAHLSEADLSGANLSRAHLSRADLRGASLSRTDLDSATLYETGFGDTNLSGARGLDAIEHLGPSYLDFRTIARSGKLPLSFLRGCGLPDQVIDYLPSLLSQAIEFYSCFISYSSKDQAFAERLYAHLQDKGVRCWFAPEDLKIGERFRVRIDEAIRLHDKLLLILSERSVHSPWVETEVETAFERERRQKRPILFPIRLDDAVMRTRKAWAADIRRTRHIGDFRRWKDDAAYQEAFDRLLRDLKAEDKKTSRAT